jgi:hypothetical protein
MISADLALAMLVNRTTTAYTSNAPTYMTYRERTHVAVGSRSQEIDRAVMVRQADNFAIMQDLPNGGERTGNAFPVIPYFDAFSSFNFSYFANLKAINIDLQRLAPWNLPLPAKNPNVDVIVPYMSYFAPRHAPDSTEQHLHLLLTPTPRINGLYPSEVIVDPQTQLPSHVEMRSTRDDMVLTLDYSVIENHWVITHGTFTATEHALAFTFRPVADITFDQFTFPTAPPNPRLAQ